MENYSTRYSDAGISRVVAALAEELALDAGPAQPVVAAALAS